VKPRGILPTYVTDERVVLCKAGPVVRNAYEIRLGLFMAVQSGRAFALAVSPSAQVDETLAAHIRRHGGNVVRAAIQHYSVYVGAAGPDGGEGDGWVAGDGGLWASVLAGLRSPWLRDRLRVGGSVAAGELARFRDTLGTEAIRARNVDDEDIGQALLRLAGEALQVGGSIFVQ
jgi:hypothetical protein